MFSRSIGKGSKNYNEQVYSVFTYRIATQYIIFAFKYLIPLRVCIFFFVSIRMHVV